MKIFNSMKKADIIFNIDDKWKYIHDHYPIKPVKQFKHEYLKQNPIGKCPGMLDLYDYGYILPMWFDLDLTLEPYTQWSEQGVRITSKCADEFVEWHYAETAKIRPHFPDDFFHSILKLHSPWYVKTSNDYSIIQKDPWFSFDKSYHLAPGTLNTGYCHHIVIPIFLRHLAESHDHHQISFRAGEPLCHILPVHRNEFKVDLRIGDKDIKEAHDYYRIGQLLRKDAYKQYKEYDNGS